MPEFDAIAYLNKPRWRKVSLGLERIEELLKKLGNPQNNLRFVHVAGTNGKGSTCAFVSSILQEAGYKTGLFTSPYITYFEERIQVNKKMISRNDLSRIAWQVRKAAEAMVEHPTEFELMTAVAFCYFAEQECDLVVAEVGLGGRLDSTNIISNVEVSAITPIAFDHCAVLGDSLQEIAQEKAGIIKEGIPVISAPQKPEAKEVLCRVASEHHAVLYFADKPLSGKNDNFSYGAFQGLSIEMRACYQKSNAALALEVAQRLAAQGWNIDEKAIRKGLKQTSWPGRFELIREDPPLIVDGGHNEQGISVLLESLEYYYPKRSLVFVVGLMADKDYEAMVAALLKKAFAFIAVPVNNPRALSPESLAQTAQSLTDIQNNINPEIYSALSVEEGLERAFRILPDNGVICACGSLYNIAAVKQASLDCYSLQTD